MKQSTFFKALKFVSHAMAKKDIRYYLNGVCLDVTAEGVHMVGTDGHRMAVLKLDPCNTLGTVTVPVGQFIIAGTDVELLLKVFDGKNTSPLYITADVPNNIVSFESCGRKHHCVPVDGKYPDWRRVARLTDVPKPTPSLKVNADYLAQASKACGALSDKYSCITLTNYGDDMGSFRLAPTYIEEAGILEAFCIVMPTRGNK